MAGGFRRLDVVVGEDETGHGRVLETGRLNSWPVRSLGCRSTSSERPRVGRAPVAVASGVSATARCTECGPARWWYNSTAPRREDATSWRLCRLAPGAALRWLSVPWNAIWCWTRAAYTMLVALEQEVAAADALRRKQHLLVPPRTRVRRVASPARQRPCRRKRLLLRFVCLSRTISHSPGTVSGP